MTAQAIAQHIQNADQSCLVIRGQQFDYFGRYINNTAVGVWSCSSISAAKTGSSLLHSM
jgi:hypothetical protein